MLLAKGAKIDARDDEVPCHPKTPPSSRGMRVRSIKTAIATSTLSPATRMHHARARRPLKPTPALPPPSCHFSSRCPRAQRKTPLHVAVMNDQAAVAKHLVQKKANINAKTKVRCQGPLRRHGRPYCASFACPLKL